ncbi:DUF1127 domain-containing protein [Thalassospira povalilytica]|uniref:DUF1127 domain-containing protein n=1 Tax=Thalassospira povalilytica TaxID=732237 RepID=A0A8I1M921_9PROT|nr:DUF1127 domain-containing protein [Thalassospira povalilytica]MBN8197067.1 DUF1127 domain-containing protein [Thalassospira povalilytica]
MVNCNDTIQLPDIHVTDRALTKGKQGNKPVTWRAAMAGIAISAIEFVARLQSRARNRHAIQLLDDHMLKDVGLSRSDIDTELSKPFWSGLPPRG